MIKLVTPITFLVKIEVQLFSIQVYNLVKNNLTSLTEGAIPKVPNFNNNTFNYLPPTILNQTKQA